MGVRCAYRGKGGSRSLRTATGWSIAEIDHLTQANLCASPTSQLQEGRRSSHSRTPCVQEGGGVKKYPEVFRTY